MTTDRPYRNALSVDYAINELQRMAGTQFDPAVVEAFVPLCDQLALGASSLTG
jgi:HD-GYP domain-containing protein (c-di-GMP phosphodiesterase class II)